MSIIEISGGPITMRYLMNKSRSDLAHMVLSYVERLGRDVLPPFPFNLELQAAVEKHPAEEWEAMHPTEMYEYLLKEAEELKQALWVGELNGEHGIHREAAHVQVVAHRIREEMRRRAKHAMP